MGSGGVPANGGKAAPAVDPGNAGAGKPAGDAKPADGAAPAADAAAEAVADEKKDEPPKATAKAFAALTKRESEVRQKEEAFDRRVREMETKFAGFEKVHEAAKKDPIEAFRIIGRFETKEAAIKAFLRVAAGKPETDSERIARLEKEREDEKKQAAADAEKQAEEQRAAGVRAAAERAQKEIAEELKADPKATPALARRGEAAVDLVWKVMSKHYLKTLEEARRLDPQNGKGIILSVKEAVKLTETALQDAARKDSGALAPAEANPPANPEPSSGGKDAPTKKAAPKAPEDGQKKQTDAQPKADDPPKFRSRAEEREYIARKYSRKPASS